MKLKKLYKKIGNHTSEIIFGVLAGSGLIFIASVLATLITIIIPSLQSYITILYIIFYLIFLIPTSIYYSKGWFRIFYLISALFLLLNYIYTKIFGVIA